MRNSKKDIIVVHKLSSKLLNKTTPTLSFGFGKTLAILLLVFISIHLSNCHYNIKH